MSRCAGALFSGSADSVGWGWSGRESARVNLTVDQLAMLGADFVRDEKEMGKSDELKECET